MLKTSGSHADFGDSVSFLPEKIPFFLFIMESRGSGF